MVETAGGIAWLKGVQSQGKVDKRATSSNNIDKTKKNAPQSFAEYRKAKAERNKKTK